MRLCRDRDESLSPYGKISMGEERTGVRITSCVNRFYARASVIFIPQRERLLYSMEI